MVGVGDLGDVFIVNSRWVRSIKVPSLRASMNRVSPLRLRYWPPPFLAKNQRHVGICVE